MPTRRLSLCAAALLAGGLSGCTVLAPLDGLFCEQDPCPDAGATPDGRPAVDGEPDARGDGAPPTGLSVLYSFSGRDTEPMTKRLEARLRIVNAGTEEVPLSALALRAYYTIDNGDAQVFECTSANSSAPPFHCNNVRATFVRLPVVRQGADHYVELTFTAAAGTLAAFGGDTSGFQIALRTENYRVYDQSNDYSFDPTHVEEAPNTRVTLHRGDRVVWGTPP